MCVYCVPRAGGLSHASPCQGRERRDWRWSHTPPSHRPWLNNFWHSALTSSPRHSHQNLPIYIEGVNEVLLTFSSMWKLSSELEMVTDDMEKWSLGKEHSVDRFSDISFSRAGQVEDTGVEWGTGGQQLDIQGQKHIGDLLLFIYLLFIKRSEGGPTSIEKLFLFLLFVNGLTRWNV